MDYYYNTRGDGIFGTGYGLLVDITLTTLWWLVVQLICDRFPDLSSYKLTQAQILDTRNRQMSFCHGLTIVILCAYQTLSSPVRCGDPTTPYEHFVLTLTTGYFIFDTLAMAWFGLLDREMFVHHSACILNAVVNLVLGVGANYTILALLGAEISNPAMNFKTILRGVGKRYTRAYEVAEFAYFGTFFFGRVVAGHPIVYVSLTCESNNILQKLCATFIAFQSYQFLYRIYFVIKSRMRERAERKEKKIKLDWFQPIPMT